MEKERTEYRGALAWMKVLILEVNKKLFIILAWMKVLILEINKKLFIIPCLDEERQYGA